MLASDIITIFGVSYRVPILLAIGDSFFIPCLNRQVTMKALRSHYRKYNKYKLTYEERVERGMLGIRVWRVA